MIRLTSLHWEVTKITNLFDKMAVLQVIGCLIQQPDLLDKYPLLVQDFNGEAFHQIVFSCIYNLHQQGVKVIDYMAMDDHLSSRPKQQKIFEDNQGDKYIHDAIELCEPENFEYYYYRVRKLGLLRYYEAVGYDTSNVFNPTIVDPTELEKEQQKLDNYTIENIIEIVEVKTVIDPKRMYQSVGKTTGQLAGTGLLDLVNSYKETPELGFPMQSEFMNFLLRGARRGTFYLRSGGTGSGKSRLSIADTICASVPWVWDLKKKKWIHTGYSIPSLIITTELKTAEVQTIVAAYVSGVSEDVILDNNYKAGEYERVVQATQYIESSPLYIERLPNFDLDDVTGIIKKYHCEKGVELVNFDYLHSSIKMIIQLSTLSKGMRLREDQMLFMASDALKTCSTDLDIHIDSATQLNGEYKEAKEKDQTLLRGSKSIADRIDAGYIAMIPTQMELNAIKPILENHIYPVPNMIFHLYKCRRGKFTRVKVWLHVDLGNCRVEDLFVTTYENILIPVDRLTIDIAQKIIDEHSVDDNEAPEELHKVVTTSFSDF